MSPEDSPPLGPGSEEDRGWTSHLEAPTVHPEPILRIERLSKTFPGTRALNDVSLTIAVGEVHALVGANGSGKSTLIKILAGYHHADPGGRAWLDGEPFGLDGVMDGHNDRMRFVHQDLGLVLELGVMDNLALHHGFVRGRLGSIDWRAQARVARRLLDRFEVNVDLRKPLVEATPIERVIVAIVAALQGWEGGRGLLVLDEPTAVLPPHEVRRLCEIIAELRRSGTSVLYVSHRLDEIFQLADRVSVLRGGELVATASVSTLTPRLLASLMAGEDVDPDYRADAPAHGDPSVALEARDLRARYLRGASLMVRKGEVVGLAGLPGSGREELPYVVSGAIDAPASGWLRVPGVADEWLDVAKASSLRLPLVPADRGREGIVGEFSVRENLTLAVLGRLQPRLTLSRRRETALVREWVDRLQVRTAGIDAPISTLSGGNQQKVVLARALVRDPAILLLCEPTAGVDIHTRIAIYDLVAEQARRGLAVLVSSTDVEDLLAMCTRVVVLRDGIAARELGHDQLTQSMLVHAMEGTD
jgi:ABC-type sugar transport system ATPase subunit